jgi:hypothetical protein
MMSALKSIFTATLASLRRCLVRSTLGKRTLGNRTAVVLARLKDLAPYAVIELLLPGGSVVALSLWFYRRRRRVRPLVRALNALP